MQSGALPQQRAQLFSTPLTVLSPVCRDHQSIAEDGTAIGIVCIGSSKPTGDLATEGGPNPRLTGNLPGWFLKTIGLKKEEADNDEQ